MIFSQRLKQLRNEHNLSALELSKKLNISTNLIYEWEHNRCKPSIDAICSISEIFYVSSDFLLGLTDEQDELSIGQSTDQTLTKDENTLLEAFRSLGPFEREAILIQINALAGEKSLIKK